MVCYVLVVWKLGKFVFLDCKPGLGSALSSVATLLLGCHVWPADPVLVLCLTLQVSNHVSLHLPCDLPWTPILPDPLFPRDAFSQKSQGEKHGKEVSTQPGL